LLPFVFPEHCFEIIREFYSLINPVEPEDFLNFHIHASVRNYGVIAEGITLNGHNLLDGSMFACLAGYKEQAYYDAHPTLLLLTPDGAYRVEIFAAFVASPNEADKSASPWRQAWDTDGDFAAWLEQAKSLSLIHSVTEPTQNDKILTLSTCTNRGKDRFVVMGRLVPVI